MYHTEYKNGSDKCNWTSIILKLQNCAKLSSLNIRTILKDAAQINSLINNIYIPTVCLVAMFIDYHEIYPMSLYSSVNSYYIHSHITMVSRIIMHFITKYYEILYHIFLLKLNINLLTMSQHLLMLLLLAITVDLIKLMALIRLSSILRYVWSPDAPTQVALRPCLGPIFGTGPGYAYQGPSRHNRASFLLLVTGDSWPTDGDGRPSWPFCNI
jgi:hypothetical protein